VPLIKDPDLRRVCYRAYNDWLAEFCATAPARFVWAGLIPIDDPKEAADEVRYLRQIGLRTGMFLAARVERALWDEGWEPLWEAGAETGLPIGFHLGGGFARPSTAAQRRRRRAISGSGWPAPRSRWTSHWPR